MTEQWIIPSRLKKRLLIVALFLGGWLLLWEGANRFRELAREQLVELLEERFGAEVQLGNVQVSLLPPVTVTAESVTLRRRGRTKIPPFISMRRIIVAAGPLDLLQTTRRVQQVRLEGLEINIPPRDPGNRRKGNRNIPHLLIEKVVADGALLRILPRTVGKPPLTFEIDRLTLDSVGAGRPMRFHAVLRNAVPPGLIHSSGSFGPWQKEEPGLTPVLGRYTFRDADLSVFNGISGTLSSEGTYQGVLERLEVNGQTDTPNFTVRTSGRPVHLKIQFHALVDGTNGDTFLEPLNVRFLRSSLRARGKVFGLPGKKGKTVLLEIAVSNARVEDLLHLALKAPRPAMVGDIALRTRFELPPQKEDIIRRLNLDGEFEIKRARFTSLEVQRKVEHFSRRARGKKDQEAEPERIASNLRGRLTLKDSVVNFSALSFNVPGALVQLAGTYEFDTERLDLNGKLRMQAKLSQTTTGIKSFLLKGVDPFFAKEGAGAVLPIQVTGTATNPSFGLRLWDRKK